MRDFMTPPAVSPILVLRRAETTQTPASKPASSPPSDTRTRPKHTRCTRLSDVTWVLQLPFARSNRTNAVGFATAGLAAVPVETFDAFEIGNELNWYHTAVYNDRNTSCGLVAYLEEWDDCAQAVPAGTGLDQVEGPHFHGLTLAGEMPPEWNPATVLDSLDNSTGNNITIIFGEVGSELGDGGSADYALNSRLGAALWTVDWLLYAITLGIKQVSMQLGIDYPFSGFQPATVNASSNPYASPDNDTDHPARVLGGFQGDDFVADFVGRDGKLRVTELAFANEDTTADAGYSGDALRKIALVDLSLWDGNATQEERPIQTMTLEGLGDATQRIMVQRPMGLGGMALATEISWAGQQWLTKGAGLPSTTRNDTLTFGVKRGVVDVEIKTSEALLVTLL